MEVLDEYTKESVMEHEKDKAYLLTMVQKRPYTLLIDFASTEMKDDKELMLQAVKTVGGALEFASDRLKDDYEVVLEAVKNDGWVICYASERLRNEKEIVLTAVKGDGQGLY